MHDESRRLGHQEAWELLPWYVNDTLQDEERRAVEEHLARCPLCRSELASSRQVALAVQRAAELPDVAAERIDRLLARLDEPAVARAAGESATGAPAAATVGRLAPAVRWALALQAAAILALALGLAYLLAVPRALSSPEPATSQAASPTAGSSAGPDFRTLAAPPAAAAPAARVRVVFDPAASEEELRRLLLEAGARFAGGPSPAGVYALEVAGGAPAAADALARLRAHPRVELAEPVVVAPAEAR